MYALPCARQNRVYGKHPVKDLFGDIGFVSCNDPTIITIRRNGSLQRTYELVDESGEFNVQR